VSNCYRYAKHTALSYDAISHSHLRWWLTYSTSTHTHKNNYFNIVYALYSPSNMWRAKVFVDSPVMQIPPSYHVWKGNEVPMWLCRIQLNKGKWREKCCWKGRRINGVKCEGPWCCWTFFTVSDWHVAEPHITCRAVKQLNYALVSFNTNHRIFCSFGGINLNDAHALLWFTDWT